MNEIEGTREIINLPCIRSKPFTVDARKIFTQHEYPDWESYFVMPGRIGLKTTAWMGGCGIEGASNLIIPPHNHVNDGTWGTSQPGTYDVWQFLKFITLPAGSWREIEIWMYIGDGTYFDRPNDIIKKISKERLTHVRDELTYNYPLNFSGPSDINLAWESLWTVFVSELDAEIWENYPG